MPNEMQGARACKCAQYGYHAAIQPSSHKASHIKSRHDAMLTRIGLWTHSCDQKIMRKNKHWQQAEHNRHVE
eukprot:366466-Chlamydomonas_euryale.AAC.10